MLCTTNKLKFLLDDRAAITACKGLRRKATNIEDLRPDDTTKLEYSYRLLDTINQFWAGPSYWKIRKSRKLTVYGETAASSMDGAATTNTHTVKRKNSRNKMELIKFTSVASSILGNNDDDSDDAAFISIDSKQAQKFKKTNVYKRWDSKKLKLPTDLHIDRNLFNYYTYCPSTSVTKNVTESVTPANDVEGDTYDYENTENVVNARLL